MPLGGHGTSRAAVDPLLHAVPLLLLLGFLREAVHTGKDACRFVLL